MHRATRAVGVLCLLVACGCGKSQAPIAPPEPPLVVAENPVERTLDSFTEFTGYMRSVELQEVRAQVTGYLKTIYFADGDIVTEGQKLYEIDPEPYQAAFDNAKATVEKAQADEKNADAQRVVARADFDRAEAVMKKGGSALSQEEYDKRKATWESAVASCGAAKATIGAAEAALHKARFDLTNCVIKSDVKGVGRISRTLLTKGNLVKTGDTVLCRITSLDPIYAYVDVDELTSLACRAKIFDKKELPDPRDKSSRLKCWFGQKDENGFPHAGVVDYIGPEITRGTGTREVRGVFPNPPPYRYGPGESVRVKIETGVPQKYLTVPELAVGSQQQQKFVYVIDKNEKGEESATFLPVRVGPVRDVGGVRLQVIETTSGDGARQLSPADRVVVNGLLRVRPGVPVTVKLQSPTVPAKTEVAAK
ncbi:efflux RND transporter periplasmic adaptor subunit [Fimbriiglobus ruber]|uniref:Putative Co/Zn/Cd efflux system membrane fusion protein n=1 Tax=Fimbriiglobus ruber TaxID=1908690 RepID=A0A225D8C9_9BACT|nr:efflux RND transporter periplasmic adaptor subunit [Fimbriiglobus ruber]OWK37712.1 putative Co/Zn/Cd efflux system membrane fusion protein [Fimbriiglobus ruber]